MIAEPTVCRPDYRILWAAGLLFAGSFAVAHDWPQYRGPDHNATSSERINTQWSGSVTNPVWLVHLTNGLTSLTVSEGRVYTQLARDSDGNGLADKEFCVALSAANGTELWARETDSGSFLFPNGGVGFTDDGPRSTPVVFDGSVFVLSSYLRLYRLDAADGAVIWSTNLVNGFRGSVIPWQNAASPVIEDGLVFVNANSPTQSLMAFNAIDGTLAWRSQNEAMTHSTPTLATLNGVRQIIFATQSGLVSLAPQTGELLWKAPYPFNYSISIGTSPVVHEETVFITANYSMNAYAVQIVLSNALHVVVPRWTNTVQRSHWSTPVAYDGHLFGMFYPDNANGQLRCVDLATGTTRWAADNFGRSSLLLVGTNLLCLTERGSVVLAAAQTNSYQELNRFLAIPNYHSDGNKCWNGMALSDGQLYVRSTAYAARFDLSVTGLQLDPPHIESDNSISLTLRTPTGAPLVSNRLTGVKIRASTDIGIPPESWTTLTNSFVLTNGVAHMTNVDAAAAQRFFIVTEPQ